MKFVTARTPQGDRPGVLDEQGDITLLPPQQDPEFESLLRAGREALDGSAERLPRDAVTLGAPLRPGKIVCVGANYAEHVREAGAPMPQEPILFLKTPDTVIGPQDTLLIPRGSTATDWEVELGVVIGRKAAYLEDETSALEHVAGYVLANDVSERHFQLERGGTWDKGKNSATFCPLGPYLTTADEVPDPQALRLGLSVNGTAFQDASTADMIFPIPHLIHYISQYLTLHPGDVVLTGTPVGVGMGQTPPRYLEAGDELHVWADGLGEQRTPVGKA